jgi:ACT domain-containing protein
MRAIVSVVGKDSMGILAKVSVFLYSLQINVTDVSQSILQDYFHMLMLVDSTKCKKPFAEIAEKLEILGKEIGMTIKIQHEDVFNSMHKI